MIKALLISNFQSIFLSFYSPSDESAPSVSKGRARGSESPTKKEVTSDKKNKVEDSPVTTPRKSSRQSAKAATKSDAEKDKDSKLTSSNKKAMTPNKNAEPLTNSRSSRASKTPAKSTEPSKPSKTSQSKSTKPLNPIDLIDELQGIEDFLRESTKEPKFISFQQR